MPEARMLLCEVSPMTQRSASTRFDLPQPFGPTTPVSPGSMMKSVGSTKDLKPRRRRRVSFMQSLFFCPAYEQSGLLRTKAGIAQGSGRNRRSRRRMPDNESACESGQQALTGFTDLNRAELTGFCPAGAGGAGLHRKKPYPSLR